MKRGAKIAIGATGSVVALVVIAAAWPRTPIEVDVAPVARGVIEARVSAAASGDVEPASRAVLRAETVGRVTELPFRAGARVKAGDLLVRFDDRTLAAAAAAARVQKQQAERDAATAEALQKKGIVTEQALLQAIAARDLARANAQVAEANLAHTAVRAPISGLLARLPLEEGDSVIVGESVAEVVDDTSLYVRAAFDEVDAVKVKLGDEASVRLDAFPDAPLHATVDRVDPVVGGDTISGAEASGLPSLSTKKDRTVGVRVRLESESLTEQGNVRVLVGMSADVEVILGRRGNVLRVPSAAIFREKGKTFAWVLEDGRLHRRAVVTGESNWEFQEVRDGLKEGEKVLVSLDAEGISDGVKARAKSAPTPRPATTTSADGTTASAGSRRQ